MPDSLIPEIYGTIEKKPDGTLYTTKAQRTGCSMCGFGIHMEKRPHRFDRLFESNPKEWDYWMHRFICARIRTAMTMDGRKSWTISALVGNLRRSGTTAKGR